MTEMSFQCLGHKFHTSKTLRLGVPEVASRCPGGFQNAPGASVLAGHAQLQPEKLWQGFYTNVSPRNHEISGVSADISKKPC